MLAAADVRTSTHSNGSTDTGVHSLETGDSPSLATSPPSPRKNQAPKTDSKTVEQRAVADNEETPQSRGRTRKVDKAWYPFHLLSLSLPTCLLPLCQTSSTPGAHKRTSSMDSMLSIESSASVVSTSNTAAKCFLCAKPDHDTFQCKVRAQTTIVDHG